MGSSEGREGTDNSGSGSSSTLSKRNEKEKHGGPMVGKTVVITGATNGIGK